MTITYKKYKNTYLWYRPKDERFKWLHCKTTRGWYQILRFGLFGVNIYHEHYFKEEK